MGKHSRDTHVEMITEKLNTRSYFGQTDILYTALKIPCLPQVLELLDKILTESQ